jgi:hypothetical protein
VNVQISSDDAQILKRGSMMRGLMKHEAWLELVKIMQEQINARLQIIMAPPLDRIKSGLSPSENQLNDLYLKGVIFGLQLAMNTPQGMINQAAALTDTLNPKSSPDEELLS